MTAQQEADRLRKEFGDKAVKVVDEIIDHSPTKPHFVTDTLLYWQEVKSELQKPVNDPFIDEVEEFHPILKKIYAIMRGLEPSIPYSQLKVSHLPPIETFAMFPKVGKKSLIHYKDGYEKYKPLPNN